MSYFFLLTLSSVSFSLVRNVYCVRYDAEPSNTVRVALLAETYEDGGVCVNRTALCISSVSAYIAVRRVDNVVLIETGQMSNLLSR